MLRNELLSLADILLPFHVAAHRLFAASIEEMFVGSNAEREDRTKHWIEATISQLSAVGLIVRLRHFLRSNSVNVSDANLL